MWWHLQQNDDDYSFNFGVEYTISNQERAYLASLMNKAPVLGPRNVYRVVIDDATNPKLEPLESVNDLKRKSTTSPPPLLLQVEQVLRRPWLDRGRLETWIETTPGLDCGRCPSVARPGR